MTEDRIHETPSPGASSPRTTHASSSHYDLDVGFFRGFLDPYLKYTSALFARPGQTDEEPLEEAVRRMLDETLTEARLPKNGKILEVGHGWGSLVRRVRETRPDLAYTGVSPSRAQHDFVRKHVDPSAALHLSTLEALELPECRYDAVFLVGVYCHFEDKKRQLARLRESLVPGGRLVLEDTFFLSQYLHRRHANLPMTRFVQQDIFGYAKIFPLAEFIDDLSDCGLKLVRALDTTDSYHATIRHWLDKLPTIDPGFAPLVRPMVRCLKLAQAGWNYTIGNFLLTLERRADRAR